MDIQCSYDRVIDFLSSFQISFRWTCLGRGRRKKAGALWWSWIKVSITSFSPLSFLHFKDTFILMLTISISTGKTNQHGRLEYGAALRHRDHQSCLIGTLAIYLFWRWHRSGEAFPCFRTSQDWYNIKLLKRDNLHLQELLNSHTASDWTKRLYSIAGLKMSRVSHAPRQSGARLAELNGVTESQVSPTPSTYLPFLLLIFWLADLSWRALE